MNNLIERAIKMYSNQNIKVLPAKGRMFPFVDGYEVKKTTDFGPTVTNFMTAETLVKMALKDANDYGWVL